MPPLNLFLQLLLALVRLITARPTQNAAQDVPSRAVQDFAPHTVWLQADGNFLNNITDFQTTLQLGQGIPTEGRPDNGGWVALWPGMETWNSDFTTGDLVQAIALNPNNDQGHGQPCSGRIDVWKQWCLETYTLEGDCTQNNCTPVEGNAQQSIGPDQAVTIHYAWDSNTNNVEQTVADSNGNIFSRLTTHSGSGRNVEFAIECFNCYPAAVPAHSYVDTKVTLMHADPDFGSKRVFKPGGTGATWGTPYTKHDDATIWYIDWIHMPDYTFDPK